ncbi:MAG: hypothetical protein J2P53_05465 [Bradyrhizobiaceae bacterium]|nr:hypothetical protein [Bradyrhizobiaceae bacterium]
MAVAYQDLSAEGLIYRPCEVTTDRRRSADEVMAFLDSDRDFPQLIGDVPNLREFATGADHDVGAFEIKAADSRVVWVPDNLAFLLPATALIIDDLYALAGPSVADQCQVSLQFFRRDYQPAERLLFDQIHRHATEGKMVIYVVTAVDPGACGDPYALGTEFYSEAVIGRKIGRARQASSPDDFRDAFAAHGVVGAPGGAVIRFAETTLHSAPDMSRSSLTLRKLFAGRNALRRSLLNIIASYKTADGTVYGRSRPPNDHRPSPAVTGGGATAGAPAPPALHRPPAPDGARRLP